MTDNIRAYVVGQLESFQKREKQIELLHYELAHPAHILYNEIINALSLSRSDSGGNHSSYISDKTLYIAKNYQQRTENANQKTRTEIVSQLIELENQQERLKYYVSLLKTRHSNLLKLLYFEGHSQEECAQKLEVATRTVRRIKDDAIDELAEMYSFTEKVANTVCPKAVP